MAKIAYIIVLMLTIVFPCALRARAMQWPTLLANDCQNGLSILTRQQAFKKFNAELQQVLATQGLRYEHWSEPTLKQLNTTFAQVTLKILKSTYDSPIMRGFPDGTVFSAFQVKGMTFYDFFVSPTSTRESLLIISQFVRGQAETKLLHANEGQAEKLLRSILNMKEIILALQNMTLRGFYINPDNTVFLNNPSAEFYGRFKSGGGRVVVRVSPNETEKTKGISITMHGMNSLETLQVDPLLKGSLSALFEIEPEVPEFGSGAKKLVFKCKSNIQRCLETIDALGEKYIDQNLL